MKHEHTRTWYSLKMKFKGERKAVTVTVRPYNAETTKKHKQDVSWSQGFTHFEIKEAGQPGFERLHPTGFSGVHWFEEHAQPLKRAPKVKAAPPETAIKLLKPIEYKSRGGGI